MELPKKIKIAGYDIDVVRYEGSAARASEVFGEFSCIENVIYIDTTIKDIQILDTLIHEINHAIYWIYSLEDEDEEERTVSVLSTAWVQVYRDNPELLELINEVIGEYH